MDHGKSQGRQGLTPRRPESFGIRTSDAFVCVLAFRLSAVLLYIERLALQLERLGAAENHLID